MGAEVEEFDDGLSVSGPTQLHGALIDSHGDHRIAMAFSVAALLAKGETEISGAECVAISFPEFFPLLESARAEMKQTVPIVITGFMGCGKSKVARELARRLNVVMIDLDESNHSTRGPNSGPTDHRSRRASVSSDRDKYTARVVRDVAQPV